MNRGPSQSESYSNCLNSISVGPEVDLPNSPGLISKANLSRLGSFNSYPDIYNEDIINQIEIGDESVESPLEQGRGTRLSVRLAGGNKTERTMKRVQVLIKEVDAWVDENKDCDGIPII